MKISTLSQSMKKVSKLVQNIFASPLRHLKTQGRLPPKRTVAENPGCWLHVLAGTKLGPKVHNPGGGGGGVGVGWITQRGIFDSKTGHFLYRKGLKLTLLCRLTHQQHTSRVSE